MEKSTEALLTRMTLEDKVSMVAGTDLWHTRSIDRLDITVDIKNTGKKAGKEVVQLYVHDVDRPLARPGSCLLL